MILQHGLVVGALGFGEIDQPLRGLNAFLDRGYPCDTHMILTGVEALVLVASEKAPWHDGDVLTGKNSLAELNVVHGGWQPVIKTTRGLVEFIEWREDFCYRLELLHTAICFPVRGSRPAKLRRWHVAGAYLRRSHDRCGNVKIVQ